MDKTTEKKYLENIVRQCDVLIEDSASTLKAYSGAACGEHKVCSRSYPRGEEADNG